MRRRGPVWAVAALLALALVAALLVARVERRPAAGADAGVRPSAAATAAERGAGPTVLVPAEPPARAPAVAAADAPPPAPAQRERAIDPALRELARLLDDPATDRVRWEIALRATAGSLAREDTQDALLAAAADPRRADSERIAAAEVLRVHDEPASDLVLPDAALRTLRAAAAAPDERETRCAAACRALAAFGDTNDRLGLVLALLDPAGGARAVCAAHGLEGARATDVVLDLVVHGLSAEDDAAACRALVTLERMARSGAVWPEALRIEVAAALRADRAPYGSERALRAVALLGALGVPEAEDGLLAALAAGADDARAAAGALDAADPFVRARLGALVEREDAPRRTRLAAAEALLRRASGAEPGLAPGDHEGRAARLWLREVVEADGDVPSRRRALAALVGLDDPEDRAWLAELAASADGLALHAYGSGDSKRTDE